RTLGETGYSSSVKKKRADLRPQEVIGAGGAEGGQAGRRVPAEEVEDGVVVAPAADHALVAASEPAQDRRQCRSVGSAIGRRQRLITVAHGTKGRGATLLL